MFTEERLPSTWLPKNQKNVDCHCFLAEPLWQAVLGELSVRQIFSSDLDNFDFAFIFSSGSGGLGGGERSFPKGLIFPAGPI